MLSLKPIVAAKTDIGLFRRSNEDAVFTCVSSSTDRALLIVADGMGGIGVGEIASQLVVDTTFDELRDLLGEAEPDSPTQTEPHPKFSEDYLVERLRLAFQKVNTVLAENQSDDTQSACTVSCAFVQADQAIIANIGDCRAYHFRNKRLQLITRNRPFSSWAPGVTDVIIDYGRLPGHRREIHVNRCAPSDEPVFKHSHFVQLNVWTPSLQDGDRLLLCSDGLMRELDDAEIEKLLSLSPSPEEATKQLINATNAQGGHDNVTVAICEMTHDERSPHRPSPGGDILFRQVGGPPPSGWREDTTPSIAEEPSLKRHSDPEVSLLIKKSVDVRELFCVYLALLIRPESEMRDPEILSYNPLEMDAALRSDLIAKVNAALAAPRETCAYHFIKSGEGPEASEHNALRHVAFAGLVVLVLLRARGALPEFLRFMRRNQDNVKARRLAGGVLYYLTGEDIGDCFLDEEALDLWEAWWERKKAAI